MSTEGYPEATLTGIADAAQLSAVDYKLTPDTTAGTLTVQAPGAPTAADCVFTYTETTGQTTNFEDSGC